MIGRLTGRLDEGVADTADLVLDVGGVGYELTVPLGTRGRLGPGDAEGRVTLHVHTHVREDAFQLFGFASLDEREAFRTLIAIANIGPKMAVSILGAVTVHELALVVARGEVGKLTTIPGVGKKTAERLVLELKGKLNLRTTAPTATPAHAAAAATPGDKAAVLATTLTRMGFRPVEAERAVAALGQTKRLDDAPMGELVREALAILAR